MESTGVVWTVVSLLVFCSLTSAVNAPPKVSCRNTNNREVNWFILYKVPRNYGKNRKGLEYIYLDPELSEASYSKTINDPNGVLANTLKPMLISVTDMTKTFGFLSYSDQPPNKSTADSKKFGHSKGVVLGDSSDGSALWLTHSTPRFPYSHSLNNFYPKSGIKFGQIFMCVSLDFSQLKTVGKHLQAIRAYTFDRSEGVFPQELKDASNNIYNNPNPLGEFETLTTRGSQELKIMAKQKDDASREVGGDLYVQLARRFTSSVTSQTYICEALRIQSFCENNLFVKNVRDITTALGTWGTGSDHSKWAVTTTHHWTCIADVNRAPTQYKRWGGALCIQDASVNRIFTGFIAGNLQCGEILRTPREC